MRLRRPTPASGALRLWTFVVAVALVVSVASTSAPAGAEEPVTTTTATRERTIAPSRVTQPGDLARSTYARSTLFTVDRAHRRPTIYAVGSTGRILSTLRVRRAVVRSPWTLAAGRGHQLWVGDIGDPAEGRPSIQVYRLREPRRLHGPRTVSAQRFVLRYPDGRHHASTLVAHPRTGSVFVVTRDAEAGAVYRLPAHLSTRRVNVLRRVASAPARVVSGSFSTSGSLLVLSTQDQLFSYRSVGGAATVRSVPAEVTVENAELARRGVVLVNGAPQPHVVSALATPPTIAPPVQPPALTSWVPDLTDDFNTLDTTRWKVRDRQAYTRDAAMVMAGNVTVRNSALRVQAKLETVGDRDYTTGDLDTYGKYSMPNYFRVEVRAKVPFEQGMWAAPIWIRPADGSAGEIDLIETYGSEASRPIIHQTIHTEYGATHRQQHLRTPYSTVGGDALDWHTYVVEKTPGKIVMWVDGVKTSEFTSTNPGWYDTYYEAGKRWSLRSSLQVGGGQGLPDATTDWSPDKTAMLIDYVKTWVPA